MGLSSRLVVGGIVAGAALAYYVQRRRATTGDGYVQILLQLPSDAQRWVAESRRRATLALEEGRSAARERDAELGRQLEAAGTSTAAGA